MILYGFGLSNWLESCLKKKMSRGKEKTFVGRKENQAKNEKEWPVKCGIQKASRVKTS